MNADAKILPATSGRHEPHIQLLRIVEDIDTQRYYMEIDFVDVQGEHKQIRLARSLQTDPRSVVRELLNSGAILPQNSASEFVSSALAKYDVETLKITRRRGWHGSTFLTHGKAYGDSANHFVLDRGDAIDAAIDQRGGTLKAWKTGLRDAFAASSYLIFGAAIAYAGPVLDLLNESEGAVFVLSGETTTGKSLTGRVMESVQGCGSQTHAATFDVTRRAVEELCAGRNDGSVFLDEAGRTVGGIDGFRRALSDLTYKLPGGRGTLRSVKAAKDLGLPNLTWRLLALATSEHAIESLAGAPRNGGEIARCIDISVPARRSGGIFDMVGANTGRQKIRKALADAVEATIDENYGVALPKLLKWMTPQREVLAAKARSMVEKFVQQVGADCDPFETRFARKFAIVLVGALFAAEAEAAPWDEALARKAIRKIYRRARSSIRNATEETDAFLANLRKGREEGRFPVIKNGTAVANIDRDRDWGFRRKIDEEWIIGMRMETVAKIVGNSAGARAVLSILKKRGLLVCGNEGKTTKELQVTPITGSARQRFVCISTSAIK